MLASCGHRSVGTVKRPFHSAMLAARMDLLPLARYGGLSQHEQTLETDMIDTSLQDYWTLVSAHRHGDEDVTSFIELMGYETTRAGALARRYLLCLKPEHAQGEA